MSEPKIRRDNGRLVAEPLRIPDDEMAYVRDLCTDEVRALARLAEPEITEAALIVGRIRDKADAYLAAKPTPADPPIFDLNELAYIHDLVVDEVAALDEMDPDENREAALETTSRLLSRVQRYFTAINRA